ncbi:EAL domain-containing protein [Filobacillus milosensis]|uniref:EAL domain-containing protein n=1 Tax=Filobacillus milosensis TaxID=94137 RepID=A0A4Y8IIV2_9BACI|nr:EAL domain-containing protein [Filobacillus milosensis]TFB19612.1 EAL domain-containing protein [Filobacillus milosensis]
MGEKRLANEHRVLSPEDFVEGYQYITEYLNEGIPLRDVLKRALKYFEDRLEDSYCTIMLMDEDSTEFIGGVGYTLPDKMVEEFTNIRLYDGLGTCGTAVVRGEFVFTPDMNNDPKWKNYLYIVQPYQLKSCWSVPVFKPGSQEVIAAFATYSKNFKQSPSQGEIDTLNAYKELIALIISNYMNDNNAVLESSVTTDQPFNKMADSPEEYANLIKESLKQGEIFPYYQPIFKGEHHELYGVEALARWDHPEFGVISPIDFIEHAETYQFIDWLDEVICHRACSDMKQLMDESGKEFILSVNASAIHIKQEGFAKRIERILNDTQFPAKLLSIEITETSLMENLKDAAVTFQQLKKLGVKVSIDDFGTTYSSLNYLKYLPVDTIKLDKTFIDDVDKSPVDRRICKTIIQLGMDLELDVIAEGVEYEKHLSIIRDFGCEVYQGFYFSKPLELQNLKDYLISI